MQTKHFVDEHGGIELELEQILQMRSRKHGNGVMVEVYVGEVERDTR
jgi:hypothetical protein